MMGNARTSVTFASAGILALSLVAVPPDFDDAKTEVRAVQLASFALRPEVLSGAPLQRFVSNQAETLLAVSPVVTSGGPSITTAVVRVQRPSDSAGEPQVNNQRADNAALAATPAAPNLNEIIAPLISIVGPIILFAPLFIILIPVLPVLLPGAALFWVQSAVQFVIDALSPPPAEETFTASVEEKASLTNEPQVSGPVAATVAAKPAEGALVTETGKVDTQIRTEQVKSTEPATGNEQISTTDVIEPDKDVESPSKQAKPTLRQSLRSVVRDSLKVGKQVRDLVRRGIGGTRTIAGGDGVATAGSSTGAPSSAGSATTGNNSSGGGDTDGSE